MGKAPRILGIPKQANFAIFSASEDFRKKISDPLAIFDTEQLQATKQWYIARYQTTGNSTAGRRHFSLLWREGLGVEMGTLGLLSSGLGTLISTG